MRTIHESKVECARCGGRTRWPNGDCFNCDAARALREMRPLSCRSCGGAMGSNPACGECRDDKAVA